MWDPPQKLPRGYLSLSRVDHPPYDAWHSSFHPDREFSLIPPGHLTFGYLISRSGHRSTLSGCLTAAILAGRHPTFSGYLTATILSGRCSTFSGYFTSGAYRRMGEGDDSASPDIHVHILW